MDGDGDYDFLAANSPEELKKREEEFKKLRRGSLFRCSIPRSPHSKSYKCRPLPFYLLLKKFNEKSKGEKHTRGCYAVKLNHAVLAKIADNDYMDLPKSLRISFEDMVSLEVVIR